VSLGLRPMTAAEFEAWVTTARESYAQEVAVSMRLQERQAIIKANSDYKELLPHGLATPNHELCMIEDEHGEVVGHVWFAEERLETRDRLFIYDIEIVEDERGRGFGRDAMQLVQAEAERRGLGRVELNVWPANHVARALYRSLGFEETSIGMTKLIES
jgi:ribosomal protein S18 acetylase RimI-like enzyme